MEADDDDNENLARVAGIIIVVVVMGRRVMSLFLAAKSAQKVAHFVAVCFGGAEADLLGASKRPKDSLIYVLDGVRVSGHFIAY